MGKSLGGGPDVVPLPLYLLIHSEAACAGKSPSFAANQPCMPGPGGVPIFQRTGAGPRRIPMRVFFLSLLALVVLAVGFHYGLNAVQKSSADAYATSSTRLDRQEAVDFYGREVEPS